MTGSFDASTFDAGALALAYEQEGYCVLKNVFSPAEVDALREEAFQICSGERGDIAGKAAISADDASAEELLQRVLAIHFPHKVSEPMRETLTQPDIVRALNAIIGPDVKCMQSMLFVKNAGKPGQAWHQDEHYIPTRDRCAVAS